MVQPLRHSSQQLILLICLLIGSSIALRTYAQAPAWQAAQALVAAGTTVPSVLVQATATDASGNVYIAGQFSSTLQLGSISLNSSNGNGFLAKWSPASSSYVWAQVVGNDIIAVSVSGTNVYVAGDYTGPALTVGSTTLTNYDATGNTPDLFVAKYADAGTSVSATWAQRAGGIGYEFINGLVVSGSTVYLAGLFGGATAAFGNTLLTNAGPAGTTSTNGTTDLFVAKLTDAGSTATYGWALRAGGIANDEATGLAVSGSSVYVAGGTSGTASFGALSLTSAGALDAVVAKITDAGSTATYTWVQRFGGVADDELSAVAVSGSSVYVSGAYANATLAVGSTILNNVGQVDGFVARLTDTGTASAFVWAQNMGSTAYDVALALAINQNGVYVTGFFGNGVTTASTLTLGSTVLTSAGTSDIFVARLLDAGTSASYTWGQRAGGAREDRPTCLAIAGSRLYVGGYFTSTTASFGTTTLTNPGGASGGEAGFFASLADPLLPTHNATLQLGYAVYPNPAHGTATVRVPASTGPATLTLLDALGRTVGTHVAATGRDYPLGLTGLAPGVYTLRVQSGEAVATQKLVVE